MSATQAELDELSDALTQYARYDWLVFGDWNRLHCPVDLTPDPEKWCLTDVTFACGLHRETAWIPGIITRMGAERCAHCCDAAGFPRGVGSPKNDPECKRILDLPTSQEVR